MKSKGSLGKCRIVIRELLRYLMEHPDAKDTIEGILRWWLPDSHGDWGDEEVHKVLDVLTSKAWLKTRDITASQKVYGLNKDKMIEIKEYLREIENIPEGE